MSKSILDASALLALINEESGKEQVIQAIRNGAIMSAVNFSEVIAKLSVDGLPEKIIHEALDILGIDVVAFDIHHAHEAGLLRPLTKHLGLSFGDRACLALAQHLHLPVITADRTWTRLSLGIVIQVIR